MPLMGGCSLLNGHAILQDLGDLNCVTLPQSFHLSFSFSAVMGLVTQVALCVMAIEEAWRDASLATSPPPCSEASP